jgi:GntR family transcriptional regulator / MocR family aminotransferase
LQGTDPANRVIYIGTFSKVLFPALRLGFLILPLELVDAFKTVRSLVDMHPPVLDQAVIADFIGEGHMALHLRRMRKRYAERRASLLETARHLPLEVIAPEAGLHCVAWLPDGMDDRALVQRAAEGVDLVPVSNFCREPTAKKEDQY